jgi:uncharacterized protein YfaT (DUF1175 family)
MTELLRQAILFQRGFANAQIEKLPPDRQDTIAAWLIAQVKAEQNSFLIDPSDSWTEQDRSDVTNFSVQYADSIYPDSNK